MSAHEAEREEARIMHLQDTIDVICADQFGDALAVETWDFEQVCAYMRWAFARGYITALTEKPRGRFLRDNGYATPKRGEPA